VRGVEGIRDVDANVEKAVEFQRRPVDEMFEGAVLHKFHDQKGAAALFADVVNGSDVGMIESGSGIGLRRKRSRVDGLLARSSGK